MAIECYKCHKEIPFLIAGTNVSRNEDCPSCRTDLHCCRMCEFYDPKAYNECRESSADRVVEKEKANYCDFFKLSGKGAGIDPKQAALDALNALFKK